MNNTSIATNAELFDVMLRMLNDCLEIVKDDFENKGVVRMILGNLYATAMDFENALEQHLLAKQQFIIANSRNVDTVNLAITHIQNVLSGTE